MKVVVYSLDEAVSLYNRDYLQIVVKTLKASLHDNKLVFEFSTFSTGLFYFYTSYTNPSTQRTINFEQYFRIDMAVNHIDYLTDNDMNNMCPVGQKYCVFTREVGCCLIV